MEQYIEVCYKPPPTLLNLFRSHDPHPINADGSLGRVESLPFLPFPDPRKSLEFILLCTSLLLAYCYEVTKSVTFHTIKTFCELYELFA